LCQASHLHHFHFQTDKHLTAINLPVINLAVLLIDLAVLSIDLAVMCCAVLCCAVSISLYCALYIAVLLPLLAIIDYLAAGHSCSWLLANLVANPAAINRAALNLAVMLIDVAVVSINLDVLCCIDLAVLCIRSGCDAAIAHHSYSSSC
jgi:hypothetical protein